MTAATDGDGAVDGIIEIDNGAGTVKHFAPDALQVAAAGDYSGHKPLNIGEPGPASLLSGAPGYHYRSGGVTLTLTRAELLRLVFAALAPAEYRQLRETVGECPEIGPDRYDPASGRALRPMVRIDDA